MPNSKDVLEAINRLTVKLYGENSFEGDITEIKKHCVDTTTHLNDYCRRLVIVETKLDERTERRISKKAMAGIGSGGLIVAITLTLQIVQMFS